MASSNTISILIQAKDNASRTLQQLGGNLGDVDNHSNRLRSSLSSLAAMSLRAGAAVGVAAGAAAAAGTAIGFRFNSAVEQAEAQIMAFTKSSSQTAEILSYVKDEAAKTQFSFTDMARATAGLIPASKQTGVALKDLVRQSEILAALNPAEGLTGAAFSLKEALSGDFVSIVDRFNLPRKRLNELKEQGVPAMEAISMALKEMGIDYSLVAAQGQTTAARWDQLRDKFTMLMGKLAEPSFDLVSQQLDGLSQRINVEQISAHIFAMVASIRAFGEQAVAVFNVVAGTLSAFLGPSVRELVRTFRDELQPELVRLWQTVEPVLVPVLKLLAAVVGGLLVAALYVAIDVLRIVVEGLGRVVQATNWMLDTFGKAPGFIRDHAELIRTIIFGVFGGLTGILISPFAAFFSYISDLPARVVNSIGNVGQLLRNKLGDMDIPGPLGRVRDVIPGFAQGGYTGAGPANQVAGVVHRGEYVVPKNEVDQQSGLPRPSAAGMTMNVTNNIYTQVDMNAMLRDISYRMRFA